ncbi:retropepsin-like aspartic protease [uncultured Maricaulis sp.]|uniref:retropepsin-like aspartic protease n=1 Tax=uncultured Maricaulis sp. TaxID=174710 RepID=UPI0030DB9A49|tara:strand:- start:16009 stop:16995 length:987 start_codon:yes stop_codon:yes gene_type:complete
MSHRNHLGPAPAAIICRRTRQSLLAGLAVLTLSSAALAEPVVLERAPSGHLIVEVEIGAGGPYIFLLDTGASSTAISQPIAETLGFQSVWEDYGDVQSLTARFSAEHFTLQDLRFAGLAPISLDSVIIPVDGAEVRPVAGLLGADAIPTARYSVDFANATLTLDANTPEHADGYVNSQNLLLGQAELGQGMHGVRVMIDSGSARTLINERLRTQVQHRAGGVTYNIDGVASRLPSDTGVEAQPVLLRGLELGGLCRNSVLALQADLDIFEALDWGNMPAMVIGMDVLQYATITVDREAGTFEISATNANDACRGERARGLVPEQDATR